MMLGTEYTRKDLDREAKLAVRSHYGKPTRVKDLHWILCLKPPATGDLDGRSYVSLVVAWEGGSSSVLI